jgi:hypothetical protein
MPPLTPWSRGKCRRLGDNRRCHCKLREGFKFIKDVNDAENSVENRWERSTTCPAFRHSLNNVVERLEEDRRNIDPSTELVQNRNTVQKVNIIT